MPDDDIPNEAERMEAHREAMKATSILDNPYNRVPGWPRRSINGVKEEVLARQFVDCYCKQCGHR